MIEAIGWRPALSTRRIDRAGRQTQGAAAATITALFVQMELSLRGLVLPPSYDCLCHRLLTVVDMVIW